MEENLAGLTAQETEGLIREAGRSLQAAFNALHRSFDTYFTELHSHSERALQEALSPLGPLYSQNTRLYGDLYNDLRQYYRGSALNLDETLSEFWSRLLERTFKTSAPTDVSLSEDYLECVAKQQETLRPFGDIPRDMKAKVIRAFVTARSFVQGLIVSGEVVRKVSQVSLSPECTKALMKLVYCPHCRGLASVKPCSNYCSNVMKGCLANQADLDPEWQNLIDTMIQVVSSFSTEPSLDVVLSSIPARIYEAVHYQQENMDTFTAKVYQTCGTPGEPGTGSPTPHDQRRKSGSLTASEYKPSPTAGLRLEMQVSDLSSKLREMRQYWIQLPPALCSKLAAGGTNQDKCWNGITKASMSSGTSILLVTTSAAQEADVRGGQCPGTGRLYAYRQTTTTGVRGAATSQASASVASADSCSHWSSCCFSDDGPLLLYSTLKSTAGLKLWDRQK
ncbi:glypican-1-like protein, partial [Lates japonicus]